MWMIAYDSIIAVSYTHLDVYKRQSCHLLDTLATAFRIAVGEALGR